MFREYAKPVAIFAASRLVNLSALAVSMIVTPGATFADVLQRWDGVWYLAVARAGYPDHVPTGSGTAAQSTISFFPAFPMLVRGLHIVARVGYLTSALVIVALAGAAAAVALHRLVRRIRDEATADAVVAVCCFFPGTIALSLPYSEALALLAVIVCCLALLQERWVIAGVAGAVATATRPNTLGVVAAAAVAAFIAIRTQQRTGDLPPSARLRPIVAPVLAAMGFVGFVGYLWARTGSLTALTDSQRRGWNGGVSFAQSITDVVDYIGQPGDTGLAIIVMSIAVAVVSIVVLVVAKDMPLPLKVYGVVTLLIGLTTIGMRPRFVLLAFPIFLAWADRAKGGILAALVGTSAVLLGTYTVLMTNPGYPSP